MLTPEQNDLLHKVGPGTPMGDLMRRYWHPVAAVGELDDNPVKPVRLMGEDFVLYKEPSGEYGLLERHCPHRRADLSYGWVEADGGLRCSYHGWLFDTQGRCIGQPYEQIAHPDAAFKDKVRAKAYHAEAKAGLVWAYIGDEPAPELWDWDRYYDRGYKQVVFSTVPCNWLQCQENSIDPVHFEWLHSNWSLRLKGSGDFSPTHTRVGFDEFEFGFRYLRIREDTDEEDELWKVGRVCLWPNALYTGTLRMARAHRRREHAERGVVHRPGSGRPPVRAGAHSVLDLAHRRRAHRPLDQQPRDEPGLHRLGWAGGGVRPVE